MLKLNAKTLLSVGGIALSVAATILSGIKDKADMKDLKAEITKEVIKNLKK